MIQATRQHIGLRVVHPNWCGRPLYGTIAGVPNRFHVDVSSTSRPTVRATQEALVWAQDWKEGR